MSIEIIRNECTGCSTCEKICPTSAITMKKDEFGYLYPYIDSDLCTNCGLCEKKCPVISLPDIQSLNKAYYGRATDSGIVEKSSSGGLFSVLTKSILEEGGIVFGAVFDKTSKEIIYKNTNEFDIDELRRSKYVESRVYDSFEKVETYLKQGITVMFCGMPCHVAGLKMYLGKEYDNLFTCDFICGGAASEQFFKDHMRYLEKKYKSKVKNINFRSKIYGWNTYAFKVDFENGKTYINDGFFDTYFRGFVYEQVLVRENCKVCKFRNNHASDIILADFWGYKQLGITNDNKGISLVVTNSDKGDELLRQSIKNQADMQEIDLKYTEYNFKPKGQSEERQKKYIAFREYYLKDGFEKAANKAYMNKNLKFRCKQVRNILRRWKCRDK